MFIPKKSDGQVSVNLRKTKEKKIIKRKTISLSHSFSLSPVSAMFVCFAFISFSFSLDVGPTCPFISISWSVSAPKQFILSRFQFYLS